MVVRGCVNLKKRIFSKRAMLIIILLAMLIINITTISAQPPQTVIFTGAAGYEIQAPILPYVKPNEQISLAIHVFNKSNGQTLTNASPVDCQAILVGINGTELAAIQAIPDEDHFDLTFDEYNVTEIGIYGFTIHCNASVLGGYLTGYFEATRTGTNPSTGENILYAFFIFILFAVSIVLVYLIIIIPSENERNGEGVIIGIVKLKYLRILLIGILYPLIIVILNLMNGLAVNIATLSIFSGTLGFLFEIMLRGAWPVTVVLIVWMIYLLIKDTNIQKGINKLEAFMND